MKRSGPELTLSNYSTNQFKELDQILKEAKEKRAYDDVKKLCDEHLSHTKTASLHCTFQG